MGYILTTVLKILRLGLLAYWVVTKQRNYFPNNLIRQLVRSPGGRVEFSNPKTRFSRRTIQIGKRTMDVLRAHLEAQQMESEEAGSGWQEHELIFTNSWGGPILARNLHRNFKQFLTDAGLQPIRFHDLRHTAASWMLYHNIPVITVSRYLGHARASITLDIYAHMVPTGQMEVANRMDEFILPVAVKWEIAGSDGSEPDNWLQKVAKGSSPDENR